MDKDPIREEAKRIIDDWYEFVSDNFPDDLLDKITKALEFRDAEITSLKGKLEKCRDYFEQINPCGLVEDNEPECICGDIAIKALILLNKALSSKTEPTTDDN